MNEAANSPLAQILNNKIIAIIRGVDPGYVLAIAEALQAGGIRLLEITMNSPGPLQVIQAVVNKMEHKMLVGAGTVLNAAMVNKAVDAGAQFILSPISDTVIINAAKSRGVVSIPGAFTATEIYNAFQDGADLIKVFPASSPSYIKDLSGPLPQIPLVPTGGIGLHNILDYKMAGAVAFGIGSALVDARLKITDQYLAQLAETAKKFVEAVTTSNMQPDN